MPGRRSDYMGEPILPTRPESGPQSIVQVDTGGNADWKELDTRRFEITKTAYEHSFVFATHYSTIIFRTRIGMLTLSVLMISILLGLRFGTSAAPASTHTGLTFDVRAILAYVFSTMIVLFYTIEVGYYRRLCATILSACAVEKQYGSVPVFGSYNMTWHRPIYCLYGSLVLIFDTVALASYLSAEGSPNSTGIRLLVFLIGMIPLAFFGLLVWRYPRNPTVNAQIRST